MSTFPRVPDGVLEQLVPVLLLHDEPRGADDFADVAYNLRLSGKSLSPTTIMVQHVLKGGVHLYCAREFSFSEGVDDAI